MQDQLQSVQRIQASLGAFAAIRADGFVVCWGFPEQGGICKDVQDQLRTRSGTSDKPRSCLSGSLP